MSEQDRGDDLPLLIYTDLGSMHVLIRDRDDSYVGLSPFVAQIDVMGSDGKRIVAIPLKLEHMERIHAALDGALTRYESDESMLRMLRKADPDSVRAHDARATKANGRRCEPDDTESPF